MGLPYAVPSGTTGQPGHQAYRIGDTWASSRDDIVRLMAIEGWQLSPDYKPSDAMIKFENDLPGPLVSPVRAIRWEKD